MLIDWFTVGAQVVNFLVLMWLLKHFLYKPVLDAIDAREQRIAKQLEQAQAVQDGAEHEREKLEILRAAAKSLGVTLDEPFLQLAFLALPVIPMLKITDRGMVDVAKFEIISS